MEKQPDSLKNSYPFRTKTLWDPSIFRIDLLRGKTKKASLSYEKRTVKNRRLFFIFHFEFSRWDLQKKSKIKNLLHHLFKIAVVEKINDIYVACQKNHRTLASVLTGEKFFRETSQKINWQNPAEIWKKTVSDDPIDFGDCEPPQAQKIREAIAAEYSDSGTPVGIFYHPVFQDIAVDSHQVKGFFKPADLSLLHSELDRLITPLSSFIDLGSGDGRITLLASELGAKASGAELQPELIEFSKRVAKRLSSQDINWIASDFFSLDLNQFDIIFYAGASVEAHEERLERKILTELKPEAYFIVYRETKPFKKLNLKYARSPLTIYQKP